MYSTSRRSLNDRPTPRRASRRLNRPRMERTHICVHLRLREVSGCCVCVRASAFSSVRPRFCVSASSSARLLHAAPCISSASVHARLHPCLCACVCACVRTSAIVRVHIIKRPDASGRMKSFASGRVFRSRTFEMYYILSLLQLLIWISYLEILPEAICCLQTYTVNDVNC